MMFFKLTVAVWLSAPSFLVSLIFKIFPSLPLISSLLIENINTLKVLSLTATAVLVKSEQRSVNVMFLFEVV